MIVKELVNTVFKVKLQLNIFIKTTNFLTYGEKRGHKLSRELADTEDRTRSLIEPSINKKYLYITSITKKISLIHLINLILKKFSMN